MPHSIIVVVGESVAETLCESTVVWLGNDPLPEVIALPFGSGVSRKFPVLKIRARSAETLRVEEQPTISSLTLLMVMKAVTMPAQRPVFTRCCTAGQLGVLWHEAKRALVAVTVP